jgi:hypothetical protein
MKVLPDSAADLIARLLKRRGITRVFALCGGHIMPIWMRLDAEGIRIIDVRDERAAVHMAQAHAELTGELGVALVTAGPGMTNAITGIANAHVSRAPVLVLSGGNPRAQENRGGLQDMDHTQLVRSITRYARTVREPSLILQELDEAISRAFGEGGDPGPSYIDFPTDTLRGIVPKALQLDEHLDPKPRAVTLPDPAQIEKAVDLLWSARRVLVISGRGARGAGPELIALLDRLGAVYLDTGESRGLVPDSHPSIVGAMRGAVMSDADVSLQRNRMHAVLGKMGHHLEQRLGRRIFKIDTLLADPFHAAHVFAGGVDETRRAAIEVQSRRFPPRRAAAPEPVDVLVYGVPDSSPYAIWTSVNPILTLISMGLGYLGGMIEAAGKPGCTVIMAAAVREAWDRVHHPSYPEVWERVLTQTRDPYEITARFEHAYARHAAHIDAYRHRFAFHPIHGILATHPLKRLRHVGRVIVAGAREAHVPRHLGWETAATVEEAVAGARAAHRPAVTIAVVEQPGMPADPDRAPRR